MTFEADRQSFLDDVHQRLSEAALRKVQSRIGRASQTLASALTIRKTPEGAELYIPHYWALYVHDGRGAVKPRRSKFLVWFLDPKDDPRLSGGYPERASDIIRLTRDQFREGLAENRARAAAGLPPYMIVTKYSGPTRPNRFFEELSILEEAGKLVPRKFEEFLLRHLPAEKDTATFRL